MPHIPPSFIKNVALEINDAYYLDNSPFPPDGKNTGEIPLLGRNQLIAKFMAFLSTPVKKGVFLVTGYRGMGKTSFVNHVLDTYKRSNAENREQDSIKIIHLTIAQSQPKEIDILRLIVMSVFDEFKDYLRDNKYYSVFVWSFARYLVNIAIIPCTAAVAILILWKKTAINHFIDAHVTFTGDLFTNYPDCFTNWVVGLSSLVLIAATIIYIRIYWLLQKDSAFNRIRWLVERCYSSLDQEDSDHKETGFGVPVINIKLFRGEKRTRRYPVASTKELEFELQSFLTKARDDHSLEFIFVFDELDKLDPPVGTTYLYDEPEVFEKQRSESAYERDLRERKQAIINIITGLKNFFTTAPARFIFIAGREMFDASLADISDRQSPISSIFTYIFNIESFLKEKEFLSENDFENPSSLSYGIELYLKMLLFGPIKAQTGNISLYEMAKKYYTLSPGRQIPDLDKLYFVLQNFVTYLTYRTNGSPKKLIKEIHEFIKVKPIDIGVPIFFPHQQTLVYGQQDNGDQFYLFFSYDNQYRIGFINNLYRPFLIKYGRSFKLYSDNIIVSTPYLFDHLLKFHPFAFSMSNLELVPEVLSTNKTPSLREHIRQIIDYLSGTHIREIEIGLFDYKFYSRTLNEITFLSKVFEQESAALNYTLDESYLVKLHVRNKIRELRNTYAQFLDTADNNRQVSSIAHLNSILGDLHFFDQEYSEAIIAFEDSIRPLSGIKMYNLIMQDFVTLLTNRLKTGLCFEKMNSYESALSSYSDNSDDSVRFMTFRLRKGAPWMEDEQYKVDEGHLLPGAFQESTYYSSPLSDLLQLIGQSFMAQIHLQEKKSASGVSELKVCMALGSFLSITTRFFQNVNRNHVIKANTFLHTGNLLYFKNSEQMIELDDTYNSILPNPFRDRLSRLIGWNANHLPGNGRPVLALLMYLMGMNEMFEYRHNFDFFNLMDEPCPLRKIADSLSDRTLLKEDYRGIYFNYVATLLSNIGDCILSTFIKGRDVHQFKVEELFDVKIWEEAQVAIGGNQVSQAWQYEESTFSDFLAKPLTDHYQMQDVLRFYQLSGKYFLLQGKVSSCGFQYRKILYVLRMILKEGSVNQTKLCYFYDFVHYTLVRPLKQFNAQSTGYGERHMLNKAVKEDVQTKYAENNLSNHPESREIMLLFYYIQLKTGNKNIPDFEFLISSNNSFSAQHARIQELDFYSKYLRVTRKEKMTDEEQVCDAVNYLYSLLSILQIMNIYGSDYWMGYSYLAYTHIRAGNFLLEMKNCPHLLRRIETNLTELLGKGSYSSLDALAHFSKAKELYEQALRLHSAGAEYKLAIADMIYLEDDFNDSAYHFGAAIDRYLINNQVFRNSKAFCWEKISELDPAVQQSEAAEMSNKTKKTGIGRKRPSN